MPLAFYVKNQPHYTSYLAPIYKALPDDIRGPFYARGRAADQCEHFGITSRWPPVRFKSTDIVVVAGYEDYRSVRPAKVVFVNHGAGQTYNKPDGTKHPAYSGGADRDRTVLFLEPSERVADISRAAYPDISSVVIGPPPYLDRYLKYTTLYDPELVAISFHADITVVPESRSAFPYYRKAIIDLARSGRFKLLGHAHPRAVGVMGRFWDQLGVEFEPDWLKVLDRAGCYVIDNSSSGYEFAATGRPTVWLNAPWYRKDIEHGLRFWSEIPGWVVGEPTVLPTAIEMALSLPSKGVYYEYVMDCVYGPDLLDGCSTDRAVQAISALASNTSVLS